MYVVLTHLMLSVQCVNFSIKRDHVYLNLLHLAVSIRTCIGTFMHCSLLCFLPLPDGYIGELGDDEEIYDDTMGLNDDFQQK